MALLPRHFPPTTITNTTLFSPSPPSSLAPRMLTLPRLHAAPSSPFTERHSPERYQRDSWLYQSDAHLPSCSISAGAGADSARDDDIALQLPELKRLLRVLKEKRSREAAGEERRAPAPGNVFLVGTGPGDPELLTVKALRVIQSADLLLYDRLVSNDVLHLTAPNARLLYVGKTAGYHSRTQV